MNTLSQTRLLLNRIPPVVIRDDIGSTLIIGITGKVPFNSFRNHDIVYINILWTMIQLKLVLLKKIP